MMQLVDRIYECAFIPELWPQILAELTHLGGARSGSNRKRRPMDRFE
jgi:hypothetical protein